MIILPIVLIITSITSKKTPEERFNYEVPKPALKMFLYPKEDMEIDEEITTGTIGQSCISNLRQKFL